VYKVQFAVRLVYLGITSFCGHMV